MSILRGPGSSSHHRRSAGPSLSRHASISACVLVLTGSYMCTRISLNVMDSRHICVKQDVEYAGEGGYDQSPCWDTPKGTQVSVSAESSTARG